MAGFHTIITTSIMQLITLVLILGTEGFSLPTQQCPNLETLRLAPESRLELECQSVCGSKPTSYEWLQIIGADGENSTLESSDQLVVESVDYKDGGVYKCRCLPDGPLCEQSVYIIPTVKFFASDKYLYVGDSVEFACTVKMSEPVFPTIKLASGRTLDAPSHERDYHEIDSYTRELELWLYKQEELKLDYMCEAESFCGGKFMEKLQENITIYSYIPPEVAFTTELKLEGPEDFGKPGKVSCSVLSSPDTGSTVKWHFKGRRVPLDLGKYRVQTTSINDNLMEYALLIEDVQKEDMGPYVCRLISDFHLESENEVWISFRGENHQYEDARSTGSRGLVYIIISFVGVMMCALGVWLKRRRSSDLDRKLV